MGEQMVGLGVEGAVARLTLRRPKVLNALSAELLEELIATCVRLVDRDDIRVVVLSGEGRAFSAGADLSMFGELIEGGSQARAAATAGDRAATALEALPQVTVAAIHGHCVGGAVILAAACDLRISAADAVFSIPEVDLGIPLAWGGIPRLLREVPPAVVRDPESRAAGQAYVARVFRSELGSADACDVPSSPSVDRG